jgi:hypothetical protein
MKIASFNLIKHIINLHVYEHDIFITMRNKHIGPNDKILIVSEMKNLSLYFA